MWFFTVADALQKVARRTDADACGPPEIDVY
jgi:hypothetical protein